MACLHGLVMLSSSSLAVTAEADGRAEGPFRPGLKVIAPAQDAKVGPWRTA